MAFTTSTIEPRSGDLAVGETAWPTFRPHP